MKGELKERKNGRKHTLNARRFAQVETVNSLKPRFQRDGPWHRRRALNRRRGLGQLANSVLSPVLVGLQLRGSLGLILSVGLFAIFF
jgi:hypothetical protein